MTQIDVGVCRHDLPDPQELCTHTSQSAPYSTYLVWQMLLLYKTPPSTGASSAASPALCFAQTEMQQRAPQGRIRALLHFYVQIGRSLMHWSMFTVPLVELEERHFSSYLKSVFMSDLPILAFLLFLLAMNLAMKLNSVMSSSATMLPEIKQAVEWQKVWIPAEHRNSL